MMDIWWSVGGFSEIPAESGIGEFFFKMSNLIRARLEKRRLERFFRELIPSVEVIGETDPDLEWITAFRNSGFAGSAFDANSDISQSESAKLIVTSFRKLEITSVIVIMGMIEDQCCLRLGMDDLATFLVSKEVAGNVVVIYSLSPQGRCIIDLPTPSAKDFGVVAYGCFVDVIPYLSSYFAEGIIYSTSA